MDVPCAARVSMLVSGDHNATDQGEYMKEFSNVCVVQATDDQRFRVDVPEGWQQGRGAFGGLTIGLAIRAMEEVEDERPIRVVTAELPGPLLPGEAMIEVVTLRRGTGTTSLEAHVIQNDAVCARVSAIFGRDRNDDRRWMPSKPEMGDWRELPVLRRELVPPPFSRGFEYRLAGAPPFVGATDATAEGWIGLRGEEAMWGAPEIAALVDAFWPACFATQTEPRPMATMAYTLHFAEAAYGLKADEPLYYRARCEVAFAGFMFEMRELWTAAGELVAVNPQTFVVIK